MAIAQVQGQPDLGRGCGNPWERLAVMGHKSREEEEKAAKNSEKCGEGLKESAGLLNAK